MINLTKEEALIFQYIPQDIKGVLNINVIINMLSEHFNQKLASRLPVIAIYSIYQILISISTRYKNKYLKDLQVHIKIFFTSNYCLEVILTGK
jgi:DNA (cytosine-5)-methyltransferase 1